MSFPVLIFFSLIQGITEFLPISSSGHLVMVWEGLEIPVEYSDPTTQRAIDVAAHVGTLLAVLAFFWRDMLGLTRGALNSLRGRVDGPDARLFWHLVLASVPLVIAGAAWSLLMHGGIERQLWVIGSASIFFGLVIWWFDATRPAQFEERDLTARRALVFGLFQVLALIPGTSRSGITMAAGRALGFTRAAGTKIALLLSVPAILAAGGLEAIMLVTADATSLPPGIWKTTGLVAVLSAVSAYVTLWLFTRFLPQTGFLPYVIYRLAFGTLALWLAFTL